MQPFDCQACGACCCNTERNLSAGSRDYIEITRDDVLFQTDRARLKRLARRNDEGQWFFRLVGEEQRCVGLDGELGVGVGCDLYSVRPRGCRNVEAGDEECLKARAFFGLPLSVARDRARIALMEDADDDE